MMNNRSADVAAMSDVYTDLSGLQSIKTTGNKDKRKALQEISVQFESMMLSMMLKSMRQANSVFSEGNPLIGQQEKFYRDMFDQQLSVSLGKTGSVGIADAMFRQLEQTLPKEKTAAEKTAAESTVELLSEIDQSMKAAGDKSLPFSNRDDSLMAKDLHAVEALLADSAVTIEEPFSEIDLWLTPSPAKTVDVLNTPVADYRQARADFSADGDVSFDGSPERFVEQLYPHAEKAAEQLGVNPQVLLAQAALETGWGEKLIRKQDGASSFNLFNIKAGKHWDGDYVTVPTLEYRDGIAVKEHAAFRSYSTPQESFADYVQLINQNPRYKRAMQHADDPKRYVRELGRAGYATDPQYAEKIIDIMNSNSMKKTFSVLTRNEAGDIDVPARG